MIRRLLILPYAIAAAASVAWWVFVERCGERGRCAAEHPSENRQWSY